MEQLEGKLDKKAFLTENVFKIIFTHGVRDIFLVCVLCQETNNSGVRTGGRKESII